MILREKGEKYKHGNTIFVIGDRITGLEGSGYKDLIGTVIEIRTDEDMLTDNPDVDIYVDFVLPVKKEDRRIILKRFSNLHCQTGDLEVINLDTAIMSPDAIVPLSAIQKQLPEYSVLVLYEEWANKGTGGNAAWIFTDYKDALLQMKCRLQEERKNGFLADWSENPDCISEEDDDYYCCWLDGCYMEAHYSIHIGSQSVILSSEMVETICNDRIRENRLDDFYEEICQCEVVAGLTEEQLEQLTSLPDIADRIQEKLRANAAYWNAYYQSLSETTREIVAEFIEGLSQEEAQKTE